MGFEPMTPVSQGNRLAGGRTRPLCDPSIVGGELNAVLVYSVYHNPLFCSRLFSGDCLPTPHPLSLSPYEGEREDNFLKGLRPF